MCSASVIAASVPRTKSAKQNRRNNMTSDADTLHSLSQCVRYYVYLLSGKAALARVQLFSLARLDLAASAAQESRLGVCQTEQY